MFVVLVYFLCIIQLFSKCAKNRNNAHAEINFFYVNNKMKKIIVNKADRTFSIYLFFIYYSVATSGAKIDKYCARIIPMEPLTKKYCIYI